MDAGHRRVGSAAARYGSRAGIGTGILHISTGEAQVSRRARDGRRIADVRGCAAGLVRAFGAQLRRCTSRRRRVRGHSRGIEPSNETLRVWRGKPPEGRLQFSE